MPPPNFLLVVATILTQKFVIKKNLSRMPVLPFSFDWDPLSFIVLFYSDFFIVAPVSNFSSAVVLTFS